MQSYAVLRKRFLRLLRLSCPRRNDSLVVVTLNNSQSYLLLKLALEVERLFATEIMNLHIGARRASKIEKLSGECSRVVHIPKQPSTVTELKLIVYDVFREELGALYLLPLTAEEVYCYVLGEIMLGDLSGLILEKNARVAYPLASISLAEIKKAVTFPAQEDDVINPLCKKLIDELGSRIEPQALSWLYVRTFVKRCPSVTVETSRAEPPA